jgi:signal transduction histidine kinase
MVWVRSEQCRPISFLQHTLVLCSLAALYVIAGKLGLQLAAFHPSVTPVWPPTALSLSALLLLGYWVWPAIFIGAFVVNVTTAGSVATSLGIGFGNTLEGLLGAFLINRYANGLELFTRQRDTLSLVLCAAGLSTIASATIGVTTLSLAGYADWQRYAEIWITWWLGDAVGALLFTPVILLWATQPIKWTGAQSVEILLSLLLLSLVTWTLFHGGKGLTVSRYPLGFLAFSILIWIAVRLGPRKTATAILLCAGIAVCGTLRGTGPFAYGSPNETLLSLQAYVAVIAVTALTLAVGVSERQRAEQALDLMNRTLERRIQDRTSALQATVEQLQELNRLKSAFVGVVSHELRTPLTAMKAFTENLLDGIAGELSAKQHDYISRIRRNTDRLTRMINELMDLSKLEAGKVELRSQELSVAELFADLQDVFRPVAERQDIALNAILAHGLPPVHGDRDKLYEVLANLLENALKFTPAGGRVEIRTKVLNDEFLEVSVSDTGCGIPHEHLDRVFDKFYQVQSVSNHGGAGLGLAIAKGLVELHGGVMAVTSAPGQGSQFSFTLPYRTPLNGMSQSVQVKSHVGL